MLSAMIARVTKPTELRPSRALPTARHARVEHGSLSHLQWSEIPGAGHDEASGILTTTGLGIVGALAAGFLGTLLGFGKVTGFNIRSFVIAITGSLLALWLYRMLKKS
jgi:uncharacterized membrane protein YeaQ/YmgE (transglycosylase-associated protein family)